MSYFADAGQLIVSTLFGLLLFVLLMRVLLQLVRANFYNPICQGLYKATNPVLMPLQKVIPTVGGMNLAGVFLAWLVATTWVAALTALQGQSYGVAGTLVLGVAWLLKFTCDTLFWVAIASIVLSWIGRDSASPIVPLVFRVADIVLGPFRRYIPPIGGLDISPIVALLALQLVQALLVTPLFDLAKWLAFGA